MKDIVIGIIIGFVTSILAYGIGFFLIGPWLYRKNRN